MFPNRESGLGEIISFFLIKSYVRLLWKDHGWKIRKIRLKILLTLENTNNNIIMFWTWTKRKLEYFGKYESNDNKPFCVNCKPNFTNKYRWYWYYAQ